jgi:hypothetical protein
VYDLSAMRAFEAAFFCFSAVLALGCTADSESMAPDAMLFRRDAGGAADVTDSAAQACVDENHTLGMGCRTDGECDDHCFCNGVELCEGGVCTAGESPCVDSIECTDEQCSEGTRSCSFLPVHSRCSNGLACDGAEECDRLLGCVSGAPLYCNDSSACTFDSCEDAVGCIHAPRDLDGDGFVAATCDGDDCDDDPRTGQNIHPDALEICDNLRDDDCDGRRDYHDSDCIPSNDTCELARLLPEQSGTYSGSTVGLTSEYALSCSTRDGPDAVFRLSLTAPRDVRVIVTGLSGGVIALRRDGECSHGPDLDCGAWTLPSVLLRSLPAGDYAIIVRSTMPATFDLNVTIGDPTTVPNVDVCDSETETIRASGTYHGFFEETADDYRLSCHANGSFRDAAYRFVLESESDVVLSASTTGGVTATTFLSLTTDCSEIESTIQCVSAPGAATIRRTLAPGTYDILIESSDQHATEWVLNVMLSTPALPRSSGDICSVAVPIALAGEGDVQSGTATASITAETGIDGGTTCGGSAAPARDIYFSFELPSSRDVTLTTSDAGFHYVALQEACGVSGNELRCRANNSPLTQTWRSLPAGTYFIVLSTAAQPATPSVRLDTRPATPVPGNDRCADAIELSPSDFRYDTLIGFDDDIVGCGNSGQPDSFYEFTLTERRRVTVIASVAPSTSLIQLTLRHSCGDPANLQCAMSSAGTATIVRDLDPGSYRVIVEMPAGMASDYSIQYLSNPPP